MELTKQQAIEEHRKMWNWIADNLEEKQMSIWKLKLEYFKVHNLNRFDVDNECFCCEYDLNINRDVHNPERCHNCPLLWGSENEQDNYFCEGKIGVSWYRATELSMKGEYKEAAEMARLIANLPEKP